MLLSILKMSYLSHNAICRLSKNTHLVMWNKGLRLLRFYFQHPGIITACYGGKPPEHKNQQRAQEKSEVVSDMHHGGKLWPVPQKVPQHPCPFSLSLAESVSVTTETLQFTSAACFSPASPSHSSVCMQHMRGDFCLFYSNSIYAAFW